MDSKRGQLLSILAIDFTNLVSTSLIFISAAVPGAESLKMFSLLIMFFIGMKLTELGGPFTVLQEVSPFNIKNVRNIFQKRSIIWTLIFTVSIFAFAFQAYLMVDSLDIEIFRKIIAVTMLMLAICVSARIYIVVNKLMIN